jgi:hypothetical protein
MLFETIKAVWENQSRQIKCHPVSVARAVVIPAHFRPQSRPKVVVKNQRKLSAGQTPIHNANHVYRAHSTHSPTTSLCKSQHRAQWARRPRPQIHRSHSTARSPHAGLCTSSAWRLGRPRPTQILRPFSTFLLACVGSRLWILMRRRWSELWRHGKGRRLS